jgi:hypothetical protein
MTGASTESGVDARVAELEQRIETLERLDDATFGSFTALDWVACILGALVVPFLCVMWFRQ